MGEGSGVRTAVAIPWGTHRRLKALANGRPLGQVVTQLLDIVESVGTTPDLLTKAAALVNAPATGPGQRVLARMADSGDPREREVARSIMRGEIDG